MTRFGVACRKVDRWLSPIRGHRSFKDNSNYPTIIGYLIQDWLNATSSEIRLSKCEQSTRLEEENQHRLKILTEPTAQVPTLRFVIFLFSISGALCQAANAVIEGFGVHEPRVLEHARWAEVMAGLGKKNTSLTCIEVKCLDVVPPWDGLLYNAAGRGSGLNSTLRSFSLIQFGLV
jgi:hypothetical protein